MWGRIGAKDATPSPSHLLDVAVVLLGAALRMGPERRGLDVGEDRVRREHDAPSALTETEAEVEFIVRHCELLVEAAHLVERLSAHEHARSRHTREILIQPDTPSVRQVDDRRAVMEISPYRPSEA